MALPYPTSKISALGDAARSKIIKDREMQQTPEAVEAAKAMLKFLEGLRE